MNDKLLAIAINTVYIDDSLTEPTTKVSPEYYEQIRQLIVHDVIGYDEFAQPGATILEQAAISERNKLRKDLRITLGEIY